MTEPETLGRYEILAELGRGAMGLVYKARDPLLNRIVAIKTINMAFDRDGVEQYAARFYQEAKAAGGLSHRNIVTIYDVGKAGDTAYMAMEFVHGTELRSLITPGTPLRVAWALDIAAQIAEGLAYAHEHGVVHRDVKPANVMVPADGALKITDFGIARMRSSEALTQTGMMLGSPKYMSPEQGLGRRADPRSDIFSLGVVLYEMLTGAAPFSGESVTALMYQTVNVVPPPPSALNTAVPEVLDLIVAKMLAKTLDERYQNAAEVARDLRDCEQTLEPEPAEQEQAAQDTVPDAPVGRVDAETSMIVLSQTLERSRHADAQEPVPVAAESSPAHGVSRAFDSLEATQRIVALAADGSARAPALVVHATGSLGLGQTAGRAWGQRETIAVAAAALAGLIAALIVVLA